MSDSFIHGQHAVMALLNNPKREIKEIFVSRENKRVQDVLSLSKKRNITITYLDANTLQRKFGDVVHQGVVARVLPTLDYVEKDLPQLLSTNKKHLVLILDGVTDPHNLGACIRTADAAGVDCIIIPKDKNAPITATVGKVACGAIESVPVVRVTNLVRTMAMLKEIGFWVYGADGNASESLYSLDCSHSVAIVMGAEGKGMRRLTKEHCDVLFAIPMLGAVSSLNVSVATGVCLYEVVRRQHPG